MYTIQLQQLRFTGFHGLYPYEKKLGNEFEVNVRIWVDEKYSTPATNVPLVDYTVAYAEISSCMLTPTPLLEDLAQKIASQLLQRFPAAQQIRISIDKLHPPIPQFEGKVGVEFDIYREQTK